MSTPKKAPLIVLGITGCIAAYKACEVVRGLQERGANVHVMMTENAAEFVGPATFHALSHNPVITSTFHDPDDMFPHITLPQACDLFLIAPCTANMMAKITWGIADDLLSTAALATTAPIALSPAMNVHMYEAASTQHNLEVLRSRGVHIIEPGTGYLACGDVGKGRFPEPEEIVDVAMKILEEQQSSGADA